MPEEYTTEYNTNNYYEATKAWDLVMCSLDMYDEHPSTVYVRDFSYDERLSSIRRKSHEELSEGWSKLSKL